jgi:hypothetical protein
MEVLHGEKWADAHPACNLERDEAVGKPLLPLELRRDQCATGQCLGDPLRILESLDARED